MWDSWETVYFIQTKSHFDITCYKINFPLRPTRIWQQHYKSSNKPLEEKKMGKRSRIARIVLIGSLARIYGKAYQQQPGIDRNNQLSSLQRQTLSLHAGPPWERQNCFISNLPAIVHRAELIATQKGVIIGMHNPPLATRARLHSAPWPLPLPHT